MRLSPGTTVPRHPPVKKFFFGNGNVTRYNACMVTITIQDIERDPAGFINRLIAGEYLIVTRDQQPVAEVKPVADRPGPRPIGLFRGEFVVPDDFDAPLPDDVLQAFEGQ